jgi:hypothetical protein
MLLSECTDAPKRTSVAESSVRLKNRGWRSIVDPSRGRREMRAWMWVSKVMRLATWARVKLGLMRVYDGLVIVQRGLGIWIRR